MAGSSKGPEGRRYPWVDLLKAAGILAVIWIHAFNQTGRESSLLVVRLSTLSRFAVPGFFLASGFLQASGRRLTPWTFLTRRLRRLLVPFFVASVAAIAFRTAVLGERFEASALPSMMLQPGAGSDLEFRDAPPPPAEALPVEVLLHEPLRRQNKQTPAAIASMPVARVAAASP